MCTLRRGCKADKAFYRADQANTLSSQRLSAARSKPQTQGEELIALDRLVTPLILKGQPLTHIVSEHKNELPVSERTIYRYIESGLLTVGNLDLRRKVGYKPRKKKKCEPTEGEKNREFRKNRTYTDFLNYREKHPNTNYLEMDTVLGKQGKGKRMLTMLFVKYSFLFVLFLVKVVVVCVIIAVVLFLFDLLGLFRLFFVKIVVVSVFVAFGCFF